MKRTAPQTLVSQAIHDGAGPLIRHRCVDIDDITVDNDLVTGGVGGQLNHSIRDGQLRHNGRGKLIEFKRLQLQRPKGLNSVLVNTLLLWKGTPRAPLAYTVFL